MILCQHLRQNVCRFITNILKLLRIYKKIPIFECDVAVKAAARRLLKDTARMVHEAEVINELTASCFG